MNNLCRYYYDKAMYQSPYMVVTDYNYTRHYYIEGQRITSKIGGGFANADIYPLEEIPIAGQFNSYEDFHNGLMEMLLRSFECVGHGTGYYDYDPVLRCMKDLAEADEPEEQLFFYHPDHLGSSAFITDADGEAHQHMQYLPFGETFIDQRINWNPRFTFTDKEKDRNTGYHYFGARYYDSEVSVWLSVDPLSEKYPGYSPYNYVLQNPIKLVDEYGLTPEDRVKKKFERKFERWTKRNTEELKGLSPHETYREFRESENWLGKKRGETKWFKKYESYTRTSNTTGWDVTVQTNRPPDIININSNDQDTQQGSMDVTVDIQMSEGSMTINYNMRNIPDKLEIFDEASGARLYSSGRRRWQRGSGRKVKFNLKNNNTIIRVVVNNGRTNDPNTVFSYDINVEGYIRGRDDYGTDKVKNTKP